MVEKGIPGNQITVIAQHLPGDRSTYYSSPWAGGNFSCISPEDKDTLLYDKYTYTNLHRIQEKLGGPTCGLDTLPTTEYWEFEPSKEKMLSLSSYLRNLKIIPQSAFPSGVVYGISFETWNFNCPKFLEAMKSYLESYGIIFLRRELKYIDESSSPKTKVIFNCTGIGAHKIGGVEDMSIYPVRGQVVIIKAPHVKENRFRWGDNSATYIIPRPFSQGHVVLGGFVQKNNWSGDTFSFETEDILRRTTELLPKILDKPLEIVGIASGLRPYREGGVRIEKEKSKSGKLIIHNYGAGGYGYQAGFGMADRATEFLISSSSKL